jgi:hypothetical protein
LPVALSKLSSARAYFAVVELVPRSTAQIKLVEGAGVILMIVKMQQNIEGLTTDVIIQSRLQ